MSIESSLFNMEYMDTLSYKDSYVHRLDPRAKLITTALFIVFVVSFDKYEISALIPFVIYPVFFITKGNLPAVYIVKKVAYISPLAIMVAFFNPILDTELIFKLYNIKISGGWVSFFSIFLKFFLTVGTTLAIIACTGFNKICMALSKVGVPKVFAMQMLFLYRYIFLLTEEAARMVRARNLRSFGNKGSGLKVHAAMVGSLLLRTINRAQRIYLAMCCRGFDGTIRMLTPWKFTLGDFLFVFFWTILFIMFRLFNIPQIIGFFLQG